MGSIYIEITVERHRKGDGYISICVYNIYIDV